MFLRRIDCLAPWNPRDEHACAANRQFNLIQFNSAFCSETKGTFQTQRKMTIIKIAIYLAAITSNFQCLRFFRFNHYIIVEKSKMANASLQLSGLILTILQKWIRILIEDSIPKRILCWVIEHPKKPDSSHNINSYNKIVLSFHNLKWSLTLVGAGIDKRFQSKF